mmetsp:Transcript_18775/g.31438  ORF Transcript_18775/g.31438 Transcript_18775/m.31438 type:complete len:186 (-) Transcript_18775:1673-2230(-)
MSVSGTVIYSGTQFIWRSRVNLEVLLVEYEKLDIIEVVTYDPIINREAPRVYIKSSFAENLLNDEKICETVENMRGDHPDLEEQALDRLARNRLKSELITSFIMLELYSEDPKRIKINLQSKKSNAAFRSAVSRKCPKGMERYRSPHFQQLIESELELELDEERTRCLKLKAKMATLHLSAKERW